MPVLAPFRPVLPVNHPGHDQAKDCLFALTTEEMLGMVQEIDCSLPIIAILAELKLLHAIGDGLGILARN